MKKIQRMSDSENEIMQLIWAAGGPVTSTELLEKLKDAGSEWKTSTVLTFLARLAEKGLLTSEKHGRSYRYIPALSETEYRSFETKAFLDVMHDGSVKNLLAALYDSNDLTVAEINELQRWFSEIGDKK